MTRKPLGAIGAAALALAFLPGRSFAWSASGHEAVAAIAQYLLTQAEKNGDQTARTTLANLQIILGPNFSLAAIAPCADQIRLMNEETGLPWVRPLKIDSPSKTGGSSKSTIDCGGLTLPVMPQSEPWHFIDIPSTASPQGATDLGPICAGKGGPDDCVVKQIELDVAALRDQTLALGGASSQLSLAFLVHFAGDETQPLHCATDFSDGAADRGGNSKPVSLAGVAADASASAGLNLHSLWDHLLQVSDSDNNSNQLAQDLESGLSIDPQAASWAAEDPAAAAQTVQTIVVGAALDSFKIAKTQIYPDYFKRRCAQYPSYHPALCPAAASEDLKSPHDDLSRGISPSGNPPTVDFDSQYQTVMLQVAKARLQAGGVNLAEYLEIALGQPRGNVLSTPERDHGAHKPRRPRKAESLKQLQDY